MKKVIVVFMTVLMAVGLCFTALACNTVPSEDGLTVVPDSKDDIAVPVKDSDSSVLVMEMVEESGILLSSVTDDTSAYSTVNGVDFNDFSHLGTSVVTASFKDDSSTVDRHLSWALAWSDPSKAVNSSGAVLDIADKILMKVSSDTMSCSLYVKSGFQVPMILTVTSVEYPSMSVTATVNMITRAKIGIIALDGVAYAGSSSTNSPVAHVYINSSSATAHTYSYLSSYDPDADAVGTVNFTGFTVVGVFIQYTGITTTMLADANLIYDYKGDGYPFNNYIYGFRCNRYTASNKLILAGSNFAYFPATDLGASFSVSYYLKDGLIKGPNADFYSSQMYANYLSLIKEQGSRSTDWHGYLLIRYIYGDTYVYSTQEILFGSGDSYAKIYNASLAIDFVNVF